MAQSLCQINEVNIDCQRWSTSIINTKDGVIMLCDYHTKVLLDLYDSQNIHLPIKLGHKKKYFVIG